MKYFHGKNSRYPFFEGWYLKQQNEEQTFSVIPGIQIDECGTGSAFIQIITKKHSYYIKYPLEQFYASKKQFYVKIGNNVFRDSGMKLNIKAGKLTVRGSLNFSPFLKPRYSIMGPLKWIPCLECNHGVLSMRHMVSGKMLINNREYLFRPGSGYIEKDWGHTFPEAYLWTQCSKFDNERCTIMLSIAKIPFMGHTFEGCIAVICYRGKEYRLATYKGARILHWGKDGAYLTQGRYSLQITFGKNKGNALASPDKGRMSGRIFEEISGNARYRFSAFGHSIFDLKSRYASIEYVEKNEKNN